MFTIFFEFLLWGQYLRFLVYITLFFIWQPLNFHPHVQRVLDWSHLYYYTCYSSSNLSVKYKHHYMTKIGTLDQTLIILHKRLASKLLRPQTLRPVCCWLLRAIYTLNITGTDVCPIHRLLYQEQTHVKTCSPASLGSPHECVWVQNDLDLIIRREEPRAEPKKNEMEREWEKNDSLEYRDLLRKHSWLMGKASSLTLMKIFAHIYIYMYGLAPPHQTTSTMKTWVVLFICIKTARVYSWVFAETLMDFIYICIYRIVKYVVCVS